MSLEDRKRRQALVGSTRDIVAEKIPLLFILRETHKSSKQRPKLNRGIRIQVTSLIVKCQGRRATKGVDHGIDVLQATTLRDIVAMAKSVRSVVTHCHVEPGGSLVGLLILIPYPYCSPTKRTIWE